MNPLRTTVLISGSGSNLQALIDARKSGELDINIVNVISNVPSARGLERASEAGVPSTILEHGRFANRNEFDRALALLMAASDPELIVLAGFMRIVGPEVLQRFEGQMINLHPSLLPLYPGVGTYQKALDAGDSEHGASIHFVTEELDGGPVISQVRIPVLEVDDAAALAARLSPMEHRLVVATVELFAQRRVQCVNGSVTVDGKQLSRPLQLEPDGTFAK